MDIIKIIYVFVFGMLFKLIDDIYDNQNRFPPILTSNIDILQHVFIAGVTLISTEYIALNYLLIFTTVCCTFTDKFFNFENINTRFWNTCSVIVLIYALFHSAKLMRQADTFFISNNIYTIITLSCFAGIEMKLFKEEYSLLKILTRTFVSIYMLILLIAKKIYKLNEINKSIFILILFKMGYMVISVIHMTIFYITEFKAYHELEAQLILLILELLCMQKHLFGKSLHQQISLH